MKLSTNNASLRAACPFLDDARIAYHGDLYGSSSQGVPLPVWPYHQPPPAINLIDLADRLGGQRLLIDLENGGAAVTDAWGNVRTARGDWDFAKIGDYHDPERRHKDVWALYREVYLTIKHIAPNTEVMWWMCPPHDYYAYRSLVRDGDSTKVDAHRQIARDLAALDRIADVAMVNGYVSRDHLGAPISWDDIRAMLDAKIETADLLGLNKTCVYLYPRWDTGAMSIEDVTRYVRIAIDAANANQNVDEIVVWENPANTYTDGDDLPIAMRAVQSFLIHGGD